MRTILRKDDNFKKTPTTRSGDSFSCTHALQNLERVNFSDLGILQYSASIVEQMIENPLH